MKRQATVIDRRAHDPYGDYLGEILALEGLASFEILDLADGTPDLDGFGCLVVGRSAGPGLDPAALERFVERGGGLVALRPPVAWDFLFGVERNAGPTYRTAVDAYVATERGEATEGIRADILQFLGVADLYALKDAVCLSRIAGSPDPAAPSVYPGVCARRLGRGTAVLFAYDLCECAVRLRQGDPDADRSPRAPDNAMDGKVTAADLFAGQMEPAFRLVPQADVHQDFLVAALRLLGGDASPVVRLWHYPDAAPAVAFLSGDSDDMSEPACDALFDHVDAHGAKFTLYVIEADQPALPPAKAVRRMAAGHGLGPHIVAPMIPTRAEMAAAVDAAVARFTAAYGYAPVSQRTHSCIWQGWTETAVDLRRNGIRMDASFGPAPGLREGFLNGSGLPARFIGRDGRMIDVREQSIQYMDDCMMTPKMLLPVPPRDETVAGTLRVLDACVLQHAVFQHYFHPVYCGAGSALDTLPWLDAVLDACIRRGIPFVSDREWLAFDDARRDAALTALSFDPERNVLAFALSTRRPVRGLTLLLPDRIGGRRLHRVLADGQEIPFGISDRLEGRPQGIVTVSSDAASAVALEAQYR